VVDNATPDVVQLRRALVNEPVLALFQKGDRLAAGDLRIRVHDSATAEALAGSGDPPPGYTCVDPGRAPAAMPALSWLMDATHRSVEFAL